MTLIIIMVGCIAFVLGWIISKVMNAPKPLEAGRLGVYHSKNGVTLVRLVQASYPDQQFVYVEVVTESQKQTIPFFVKVEKLMMFTIDGEAVNEANWDK
jgi:hypothetical protein